MKHSVLDQKYLTFAFPAVIFFFFQIGELSQDKSSGLISIKKLETWLFS